MSTSGSSSKLPVDRTILSSRLPDYTSSQARLEICRTCQKDLWVYNCVQLPSIAVVNFQQEVLNTATMEIILVQFAPAELNLIRFAHSGDSWRYNVIHWYLRVASSCSLTGDSFHMLLPDHAIGKGHGDVHGDLPETTGVDGGHFSSGSSTCWLWRSNWAFHAFRGGRGQEVTGHSGDKGGKMSKMMWNKQPYDIWNPLCLGKAWSQSIYAMNLDCTGKLRPFQLNAVLIVLSTVSREGWMVLIWDLSIWISQFPTARKLQCVAFSFLGNSEKDGSMIQWRIHVLDIGPATQHDRGMWMRRPLHLWDGLWPWFPSPWSERFWRRMPPLQFERHDV